MRAHAEAMVEMWLRAEGLDAAETDPGLRRLLANPDLARPVERVEFDRQSAFREWLGHRSTADRADHRGGGARPPRAVIPTSGSARSARSTAIGPVPSLWTIGTGRVGSAEPGFPVAVPLLDESHLQITSTHDSRAPGRGAGGEPAAAGDEHFRPGAGAGARLGRRPVHRCPARSLPAHPHRAAHRARPGDARRSCSRSCRTGSGGSTPACSSTDTRRCGRWPRRAAAAPSRGSSRC